MAEIDRERVLAKLDELESYLEELKGIVPQDFVEYQRSVEKRRACERLLQIAIEATIDICALIVKGLRLGLPGEEDDLFERLHRAGVISEPMCHRLREMKGLGNILVHAYARVDDRLVYEVLQRELGDLKAFKDEILQFLQRIAPS